MVKVKTGLKLKASRVQDEKWWLTWIKAFLDPVRQDQCSDWRVLQLPAGYIAEHFFSRLKKNWVGAPASVSSWKWIWVLVPLAACSAYLLKHFFPELEDFVQPIVITGIPQGSLKLHNIFLNYLHTVATVLGCLLCILLTENLDLCFPCFPPLLFLGREATSKGCPESETFAQKDVC